jgi:hypothetical protein
LLDHQVEQLVDEFGRGFSFHWPFLCVASTAASPLSRRTDPC